MICFQVSTSSASLHLMCRLALDVESAFCFHSESLRPASMRFVNV